MKALKLSQVLLPNLQLQRFSLRLNPLYVGI